MISTYADLKTAVANWLDREDISARIPEFIQLAEQRIFQSVRCREMESATTITASITTGFHTGTLSASVMQIRRAYISGAAYSQLEYRNPVAFYRNYAGLAQATNPRYYTIEGLLFITAPGTAASKTILIDAYKKLAHLSADADTNLLLTRSGGLYLYGALIEASPFLGNDPRILTWTAMWDDIREKVMAADQYSQYSGDVKPKPSDIHIR